MSSMYSPRYSPSSGNSTSFFQQLLIAQIQRTAKVLHLVADVVDIIFTHHVKTGKGKHAGKGITQSSPPAMADMQRPRGIGAHELNHHLAALADQAGTETRALLLNIF